MTMSTQAFYWLTVLLLFFIALGVWIGRIR